MQTPSLAERVGSERRVAGRKGRDAERRRYYLYAPLYVSRESREYCSRHPAHTLRAQARGRSGEERGARRSMAGFYYRDHLFVNIIYTLRGGGSAVARAILNTTREGRERKLRRGWLLDTVDDFSRVCPLLSSVEPLSTSLRATNCVKRTLRSR